MYEIHLTIPETIPWNRLSLSTVRIYPPEWMFILVYSNGDSFGSWEVVGRIRMFSGIVCQVDGTDDSYVETKHLQCPGTRIWQPLTLIRPLFLPFTLPFLFPPRLPTQAPTAPTAIPRMPYTWSREKCSRAVFIHHGYQRPVIIFINVCQRLASVSWGHILLPAETHAVCACWKNNNNGNVMEWRRVFS